MEKEKLTLSDVKIIGDGKQHHIIIDGKDVSYGVTELNLNVKPNEYAHAELTMKSDVKVGCIELKTEVKRVQAAKEKRVVIKYETSLGLEEIVFKNANNISTCIQDGVFIVEEHQEKCFKELAVISLDNFVSYEVREIENKL